MIIRQLNRLSTSWNRSTPLDVALTVGMLTLLCLILVLALTNIHHP